MKAVQLLVNSFLPEDARDYSQTFDAKSLNNTLYNIATNHPDKFAGALKSISDIGRKASYYQGETINLKDLESPIDKQTIFAHMDAEIAQLPPEERNGEKKLAIFQKYNELIQKMTQEIALANRNNIAMTILSGARGKNPQLKAMITTPGTFSDYKGRVIPVFSKESFAEGIRPAVFLASTYGARSSVISTKCLGEDTLVRMGDLSVKKIQDIKVGDFVLGSDKSGRVFPVKVLNTFDQGEKECYKYDFNFSNGFMEKSSVVCTEDHKFLMVSAREYSKKRSAFKRGKGEMPTWEDRNKLEIVKAGKMRRGSRASVYNPLYPQGGYSGKKEEPWARIIGLLIGDGSLTCNGRITLSCADTLLIGDIEQELTDLGHKINKVKGDNYSWSITQLNYNAANNSSIVKGVSGFVKGNLNPRNAMLKSYGLLNHYAWEKRFPLGWDTWSKESVAKLIAGLFAADGSVFKTTQSTGRTQVGISFAVTSEDLIKDLKLALSVYFGITAREEREVVKGGFGSTTELRVHPLYTLEIARSEDVLKFRDCFLEYIPGIKNFKLSNLCSYVDIKQHNPYAKHMFMRKECVGKIHCFDIEVDHPDHLFVLANGLITSNSATAKGGDFSKQLASTAADMVIRKNDCGTSNGIELETDDKSLKGRVLAKDTKGIPAGTFITRDIIDRLRKSGVEHVVARSPLTCAVENGLCAHCVGKFYKGGKLPRIGDSIGLTASSVVGEPIAQGALCLEENTLVRMADGSEKKIKDIVPGEYVVGSDKSANTFPVRVLDVFDQGYKEVSDYVFRRGQTSIEATVTATEDHKFLLNKRSSSANNLAKHGFYLGKDPYKLEVIRLGDMNKLTYSVFPSEYNYVGKDVDLFFAYMLGLYLGDGIHFKGEAPVKYSCADPLLVSDINKEACKYGLNLVKRKRGYDYAFTNKGRSNKPNPFKKFLRECDCEDKYCYNKTFPSDVLEWSKESLCALVAGYFDSDGSVYATDSSVGVSWVSASNDMVSRLKDILELRLSIYCGAIYEESELKPGSNYIRSSIAITRRDMLKRFFAIVGKYSKGVKREKINSINLDDAKNRNPSGYMLGRIVTKQNTRTAHCYDIEVDHPDHLFVLANGLITSNSAKHTAGMSTGKKSYSGLEYIAQFTQSPEEFRDRAPVTDEDGIVESIEEAPQGGTYITVNGKKYYAGLGHEVLVSQGQQLEAGDQLAEGLIDPEDIVRTKGLGAGMLYYANRLNKMLEDSSAGTDKRNTEVLARAAMRHVKVDSNDGIGSYLPDDIVDYRALMKTYTPPETSRILKPSDAVGKYLQKPVLHYTVGTRITPSVAKDIEKNDYNEVLVDEEQPQFSPVMVRLRAASHTNPDWLASMSTSYLAKQLNESSTRGDDTNILHNTDFRPRLAVGAKFGENVRETGEF